MVTGEGAPTHVTAPPQPGGRPPAPGDLGLVQAFVNSHFDLEVEHGAELFATPAGLVEWLAQRGLIPADTTLGPRDLERAVATREGLRGLAGANNATGANNRAGAADESDVLPALNRAARGARVEVRFGPDGPRFTATGEGLDRALGALLAITASAMLEGTWRRLKVCPGHHCGWAFYDHSRNQTGRWCSMRVCGGRAKARAHYQRLRGDTPA